MAANSIPARYTDLEGPGTIRPGRRLDFWTVAMSPDMRRKADREGTYTRREAQKQREAGGKEKWLHFLPLMELPREVCEDETEVFRYWLKNPHIDPWKLHEGVKDITVPNLNFIGWNDHCNGDLLLDRTMHAEAATEIARTGSRTVIGPWDHVSLGSRRAGEIDFGSEAEIDMVAYRIHWFEFWLKGEQNGIDKTAPYRIFIMGENRWRDEQNWPLKRAMEKVLYLTSGGHANTPTGDGALITDNPRQGGVDTYIYDPEDPVPSFHGKREFPTTADQRPLAKRKDILVFQTEPLAERIEVTGNPVVELYAASSAPDTDFFVRLIDVAPEGIARDVSLGVVRARYRDGLDRPKLIEPGKVVIYTIRMNPLSNAFLPGHRIRVDITSSDFPSHDRNHNTAVDQNSDAELRTAMQTIHHGGDTYASKIILPWIEKDK
jgi:hypothetical protein